MQTLLNSKKLYFSGAIILCALFLYQILGMGLQVHLFVLMVACIVIVFGIRYPVFGLLFAFASMNSFFNLIPRQLLSGIFINKTWDFGFFLMIIFGSFLFIKDYRKMENIPFYLKIFVLFLSVCFISFFLTVVKYDFPLIDTIRSFRYYLGYLFIPFLLQYFLQAKDEGKVLNINKFLNALYVISFILLLLYNFQFLIQTPLFLGYSSSYSTGYGSSYIRSIPNFLFICYFFLWFNLAAWLTDKKMFPMGKLYIILCVSATLFTFTRGVYISVSFSIILLFILMLRSKKYNTANIIIACFIGIILFSTALMSGYLKPFTSRASTITESISHKHRGSTFWYRIGLIEDRIRLINKENPLMGLGFVHNKYGYKFGNYGDPEKVIHASPLGSADIAWVSILYQTGWIGFGIFGLYIISIIKHMFVNFKMRGVSMYFDKIFLFEIASVIELLRMIFHTMNSSIYTSSTQNVALIFAIGSYSYMLQITNRKRVDEK